MGFFLCRDLPRITKTSLPNQCIPNPNVRDSGQLSGFLTEIPTECADVMSRPSWLKAAENHDSSDLNSNECIFQRKNNSRA